MLLEHERNYGLGMGALVHRMLLEHERNYGMGMDALGHRMLLEHERNYGLGMDALGHRLLLQKPAMRGGTSDFEASEGPKALFVPRRPVPMCSGGNAFFLCVNDPQVPL